VQAVRCDGRRAVPTVIGAAPHAARGWIDQAPPRREPRLTDVRAQRLAVDPRQHRSAAYQRRERLIEPNLDPPAHRSGTYVIEALADAWLWR
jgi:hypothetical protein